MPGTVWRRDDFDPSDAVETLYNATINDSLGTDEDAVVQVIGNHNSEQRIEIATRFKQAYGRDLIEVIKSELGGDFEDVVVSMLTPPVMLDVQELNEALSGGGTDETTLIEVLATKTNAEIKIIKEKYKQKYDVELEEELSSDTSGDFRNLMVSLVCGDRADDDHLNFDQANEDVTKLVEAGPAKWGTDEGTINYILCTRSRTQLEYTFKKFEDEVGTSIEEMIKDEIEDDHLQDGFLAIVTSTKSLPLFWAQRIRKCCSGLGTSDNHLIRIIVSRSEIDMTDIDECYIETYGKSVAEEIESECSGDYKKMLLALVTMQE